MNQRRMQGSPNKKSAGILSGIQRQPRTGADTNEPVPRPIQKTKRRTSAGHMLIVCLLIFLCAGAYIYHLNVRFDGVRLGYEASRQRKIQTRLLLERRELRLELASLKEQNRIELEARKKLGMEIPTYDRIIPVDKKRRVVSVSGGAL